MSVTIDELIKQIEELRLALIRAKVGRAYSDPVVVAASQKLDEVLNKYQEFTKSQQGDPDFKTP